MVFPLKAKRLLHWATGYYNNHGFKSYLVLAKSTNSGLSIQKLKQEISSVWSVTPYSLSYFTRIPCISAPYYSEFVSYSNRMPGHNS